jgi:hemoglobin
MVTMRDVETMEDVQNLVNTFYGRIREDELLGPIFNDTIQDRWPEHLEKMYSFWQTILLQEHTYSGRPFFPHMKLPIHKEHFDHWLSLFFQTVDELFQGKRAELAKWQGNRMADMFQVKLNYFRENAQEKPIL